MATPSWRNARSSRTSSTACRRRSSKSSASGAKSKGKDDSKQTFAAARPAGKGKAESERPVAEDDRPKRALGLRGAAPWAARHAAKHAAEARKRAAEPPPPGSARATIRTPSDVDAIKQHIGELHNAVEKLRSLRKNLPKTFFDIGTILRDIQARKLYSAKGFQSFESFVEREADFLGKTAALRLVRLVALFQREAVLELGMERAFEALAHLEGGESTQKPASESRMPASKPALTSSSASKSPIVGRLAAADARRRPHATLVKSSAPIRASSALSSTMPERTARTVPSFETITSVGRLCTAYDSLACPSSNTIG